MSIWTNVTRASVAVALVGLGMAAYPLYNCTSTVADLMFSPGYPDLDPNLLQMAKTARGDLVEETAPKGVSRWSVTAPVCTENLPATDYLPGLGLFIFGIFGIFVGRRGDSLAPDVPEIDEERVAEIRANELHQTTKPATHADDVKAIEVDVDDAALGIGTAISPDSPDAKLYEGDDDTLMAFVEDRMDAEEDEELPEAESIDGFFCPPGYGNKPVAYVDPSHPQAADDLEGDDAFGNFDRPWASVDAALEHIRRRIVTDVPGAMIRLVPGVYQASIDIPDRVCIVNHRTPAEGDDAARLRWISSLTATHPDAVTILPPSDADYAVKFTAGRNHGLVGCHVVSRDTADQHGILTDGAQAVGILYCVIDGFKRGGMKLTLAGNVNAGMGLQIRGCVFQNNTAAEGGAVCMERSVAKFHSCIFKGNHARTGGGVLVRDCQGVSFEKARFDGNRAEAKPPEQVNPEAVPLADWGRAEGLGGGLMVTRSKVVVKRSEFVDNGASFAGGGVAVVHGSLMLVGDDKLRARLARNKSRVGGGAFVVGLRSGNSTVRFDDIDFEQNTARAAGGGLAIVGLAEAKVSDAVFSENAADGDRALGGGVAVHLGAKFLSTRTVLRNNKSAGHGGGICSINGSVKFGEKSDIADNLTKDEGGGAYVITRRSTELESMINAGELDLPFVFDIDAARVRRNAARGMGGGVRLGNTIDQPTPALGVKLNHARIRSNITKSDNGAASDIWFEWAGQVVASGLTAPERKFVLK